MYRAQNDLQFQVSIGGAAMYPPQIKGDDCIPRPGRGSDIQQVPPNCQEVLIKETFMEADP